MMRKPKDRTLTPEELKELYHGIRRGLERGELAANLKFIRRLDTLRLQGKISSTQHRDLSKTASVRSHMSAHASKEARTKQQQQILDKIEDHRRDTTKLRDVGQPPDEEEPVKH